MTVFFLFGVTSVYIAHYICITLVNGLRRSMSKSRMKVDMCWRQQLGSNVSGL